jgi:foldase protein PrsA
VKLKGLGKLKTFPKKFKFSFKKKEKELERAERKFEGKIFRIIPIKSRKQLVVIGVAAALILFLAVMGIGIYGYKWEDRFTYAVSSVVPYPAQTVNGKVITYHTYLENLNILKKYESEFKKVDFKSKEGKEKLTQMRTDTLARLTEDILVAEEAKDLKVTLTQKELDESYAQLIKSNGGDKSFAEVLNKYYGMTPEQFKNDIYKSRLLRQKLLQKFSSDENLNSDAKKKAEELMSKIKAGGDFTALAKENSQDSTASAGGDLGFFGKGKMVPEFEQAAFALKAGQTSEIIKTVYGYHIIKVLEVKGDQVHAAHILIKTKDFQSWLDDAVKNAKVHSLVKK